MDGRRIDPEEERRHRTVLRDLGVYDDVHWALSKVVGQSDIKADQNRLLITRSLAQDGSLPEMFPELEEVDDDGKNVQKQVDVTIMNEDGVAKLVIIRFLNSNGAYRIKGRKWMQFVKATGICIGDRLDLYTCKLGDGQRCLFFFKSKGGGSPRSNGRKRNRQPAGVTNGGNGSDTARANPNYTRSHPGDRSKHHKRAKKSDQVKKQAMQFVVNDGVHGCTDYFQNDFNCVPRRNNAHYECFKSEITSEEEEDEKEEAWRLWDDATWMEKEAATGLLMLKFSASAKHN